MKRIMERIMERLVEKKSDDSGFSLLELVIAIGIILVLTVGGLIGYGAIQDNAKRAATEAAASEVATAAMAYDTDGTQPVQAAVDDWNNSAKKGGIIVVDAKIVEEDGLRCVRATATHIDGYLATRSAGDPGCTAGDGVEEVEVPEDVDASETTRAEIRGTVEFIGELANGSHNVDYMMYHWYDYTEKSLDNVEGSFDFTETIEAEDMYGGYNVEDFRDNGYIDVCVAITGNPELRANDCRDFEGPEPTSVEGNTAIYDLGTLKFSDDGFEKPIDDGENTEEPVITGPDYVEKFNCPAERPVRVEKPTRGDRTYLQSREKYIADNGNADGFDESFANRLNNDGEAILFLSLWSCDDISRDDITVTAVPVSGNGTTLTGEMVGPENIWFYGASRGEYRIEISGATLVSDPTKSATIHVDENGSFSAASGAFDTPEYTIIAK